jgi:hypothetical protein
MDILDRTLQKLDPEDSAGSFSEIENYLSRVMETIDFTLSRHRDQISSVDPARIKKLEQAVGVLNQDVSSLKSSVKSLENRMSAAEERLNIHDAELQDHETRIKALENKP